MWKLEKKLRNISGRFLQRNPVDQKNHDRRSGKQQQPERKSIPKLGCFIIIAVRSIRKEGPRLLELLWFINNREIIEV